MSAGTEASMITSFGTSKLLALSFSAQIFAFLLKISSNLAKISSLFLRVEILENISFKPFFASTP